MQTIARGVFEVIVDQSPFVPEETMEEQKTTVGDSDLPEEEIAESEVTWRKTFSKKKTGKRVSLSTLSCICWDLTDYSLEFIKNGFGLNNHLRKEADAYSKPHCSGVLWGRPCASHPVLISQDGGPFFKCLSLLVLRWVLFVFVVLAFQLYFNTLMWTGICRGSLRGGLMCVFIVIAHLFL